MPTWVIIAALATIGITALLTGVLYRLNAPALERRRAEEAALIPADGGSDRDSDAGDAGSDGGGSDGGGD